MSRPRIVVVGAGHLGRIHTRLLAQRSDVELIAVTDPSEQSRQAVQSEWDGTIDADYRLYIEQADAFVVVAPTIYHYEIAQTLIDAGKHVLVEKPMTNESEQAEDLVRRASRKGTTLQVGHVERFNPVFSAARHSVGQTKYIEAVRSSGYSFRSTDIGVVFDLMIHDIDLVLNLAQSEVVRVDAIGLTVLGPHEDIAHARLRFANGCVANLSASRTSYQGQRTMNIFGTDGFAALDMGSHSITKVVPSEAVRSQQIDVAELAPDAREHLKQNFFGEVLHKEEVQVDPTNAIQDEHTDFLNAIVTAKSPQVSGSDGWKAVQVAELVLHGIERHSWDGTTLGPRGAHALWQTSGELRKAG